MLNWQNREMSSPVRPASARGILAALTTGLGALHLAVAPGRSADWRAEGIALAVTGVVLIALGLGTALHPSRAIVVAICVAHVVVLATLLFSRTSGYPFGPWQSITPSMGAYEVIVIIVAAIALSLALAALVSDPLTFGAVGWRFEIAAPFAVVLVAIPGLVTSQWADDAAHLLGSAHTHSHTDTSPITEAARELTVEQRAELGAQIVTAREMALSLPTLADALEAGWVSVGDPIVGGGQLVMNPGIDLRDMPFDPATPMGLLYASARSDAPVVGVQYAQWSSDAMPADGFVGQAALWHLHTSTCVLTNDDGTEFALTTDDALTGPDCAAIGATKQNRIGFMLRAWVVPGWENPYGVFAHDHPALG